MEITHRVKVRSFFCCELFRGIFRAHTGIFSHVVLTNSQIDGYEELTDSPDDRHARDRARQIFEPRPEFWLPAAAKLPSAEHPITVVYRIRIDRLTGRRAVRQA